MDPLTLEQKQQQFHEFFTIKHNLKVNIQPVSENFVLPSLEDLPEHMPYAFRIAGEVSDIESQALRSLRNLSEHATELADFLNHQSRKIDLMMSFILHQQDDEKQRYQSIEFGGGGITILSSQAMSMGTQVELKLFLTNEAAAIFCFAEVISCESSDDTYHISLIYTRIREQDQELLVRASLHLQTLQLRQRAKQNKNDED
jgi:hypothetical protein